MWSPVLEERGRPRAPEPEPPPRREHAHAVLALQRSAGNRAVSMLMRDPTKKGGTAAPTSLTAEEKKDKVRILTDWVLYTPRSDFRDEWGKPAIKTEEDYFKVLLAKIRGANNVQESLKSQSKMLKVAEDDDWGDGSYNATTLRQVIRTRGRRRSRRPAGSARRWTRSISTTASSRRSRTCSASATTSRATSSSSKRSRTRSSIATARSRTRSSTG
jgi:hypothetical protein